MSTRPPDGATDDPVGDWGPDRGRGLFDRSETTNTGEVTSTGEVTGTERTAVGVAPLPAEDAQPAVAVLAWIAATLELAPGEARGEVAGLRERIASEPLDLLPGCIVAGAPAVASPVIESAEVSITSPAAKPASGLFPALASAAAALRSAWRGGFRR